MPNWRITHCHSKAAEEQAWRWTSDGKSGFEIESAERPRQGTTVTLYLNEDGKEYANSWKLREIIKKYSNHIAFPIYLTADKSEWDEAEKKSVKKRTTEQINSASALWKRPKSELKDEDYKELYKTISGDWEDPMFWFHTKAEGTQEYTTLFFVPSATFLEDVPTETAAPLMAAPNSNERKLEEAPKSRLSSPDGSLGIGSLNKRGRT